MKALEKDNKPIIDLNMDLNELVRDTFGLGEPIIDMTLYCREVVLFAED